jgi:hypothetical protein
MYQGETLADCPKSPPAAFSHRSGAQRTPRVRLASSLAAALLDGLFEQPAASAGASSSSALSSESDQS